MGMFDDLLKHASDFVEKQKGLWDREGWEDFISELQKKGVKLNEEMQNYLGLVVESMKKFYSIAPTDELSKGISEAMSNLSDQTAKFIEKTKGAWDHAGWEKFLKDMQNKGIKLTDETASFAGDILESAKKLYSTFPPAETKKTGTKKAAAKNTTKKQSTKTTKATKTAKTS